MCRADDLDHVSTLRSHSVFLCSSFISILHSAFIVVFSSLHHSSFCIHRYYFTVHHSSFCVHRFPLSSPPFIIHHSAFLVAPVPLFIIYPSAFILSPRPLLHSSFIILRSSFSVSLRCPGGNGTRNRCACPTDRPRPGWRNAA